MLDVGPSRSDGTGDRDGGADGGLAKARACSGVAREIEQGDGVRENGGTELDRTGGRS